MTVGSILTETSGVSFRETEETSSSPSVQWGGEGKG